MSRLVARCLPVVFSVCSTALASGQDVAEAPTARLSVWDSVYTGTQARRGQGIYRQLCVECHGANLRGGEMAAALVGVTFQFRWVGQTVGALFESIRTTMPQDSPASLSDQAYVDLAAYLLQRNRFPAGENELHPDSMVLEQIVIEKAPSSNE